MPSAHRPLLLAAAATLVVAACTPAADSGVAATPFADSTAGAPAVATAAQSIDAGDLLSHIRDLSADSMEGRGPGTPGEEKTVAYLTRQFQQLGLQPGNPDGSWVQNVDLIGYASRPSASLTVGGKPIPLSFPTDFVASSRHERPETRVDGSDIVFVGYGVVAPEYGWDDYKGVDVTGKTILMLINDPAVPAAGAPVGDMSQLDSTMFKGKAMTYYGRWTYKYEIAGEKGAAAAIIIHETQPAGYPFEVVSGSFGAEQFDVPSPTADQRVPVEGWMTLDKAKALLSAAGYDFDSLKAAATRKDFTPVVLPNAKASFDVKVDSRRIQSKNVVAKLPGGSRADEYVIYTAHWDHLGRDTTPAGDQIFNGALDNASGTSGLLEIAQAFTKLARAAGALRPLPRRDGRGEGAAGREVLRRASAVSAGEDGGGHQHGRAEPVGPHERHGGRRPRQLHARRRADARARGRPAHRAARRRAGEGLLLPQRPLRVREAGRAGAVRERRARASSARTPRTACRSATRTPSTTTTSRATR